MKQNFEDHIKNALSRVDESDREPNPGHEERFEMRLLKLKTEKPVRFIPSWVWMAAASVVLSALIVNMVVGEMKKTDELADRARLSDVSAEMAAVEVFYNEKLKMDTDILNASDPVINRFLQNLSRLESEYKKLEQSLSRNFSDERIARAMVSNYKFRLQLMEQLGKYIEVQNKLNSHNNDQKMSS